MLTQPLLYSLQVLALCTYPELLESDGFPEDAKCKARSIMKQLDNGSVGSYSVAYITQHVPQRIASFIQRRDGAIPSDPRNIIVCSGATQGILTIISLVTNTEEPLRTGIMISVPRYSVYMDAIVLSGAVPVDYPLDEENEWALNVQSMRESLYIARKHCNPKVLCVINPGNPTGQVQSRECIEEVIRLAAEEKLLIFADEVYQENIFAPGSTFHSFKKVLFEMGPQFSKKVQLVSIHSVSKGFHGECGFRAGFLEFVNIDPSVFEVLYLLKSFSVPPVPGVIALDVTIDPPQPGDTSYDTFIAEKQKALSNLGEKARLAEMLLNQVPGIQCNPIQGALHFFPRIHIPDKAVRLAKAKGQEPDVFFCHSLLEETGIILVPGSDFGQVQGTYHIRITIINPIEELENILNNIIGFYRKFVQEYS
ncbi:alanine aminotransferase 2-like [Bombina bombina]|uniref:alanine aminotransferase 2-like n=1 Tax=Bombina bombina TaxID=8345 RepID=UPI00235AFC49|nr:alanine aminotransferase 2-like [Bombina bombina]